MRSGRMARRVAARCRRCCGRGDGRFDRVLRKGRREGARGDLHDDDHDDDVACDARAAAGRRRRRSRSTRPGGNLFTPPVKAPPAPTALPAITEPRLAMFGRTLAGVTARHLSVLALIAVAVSVLVSDLRPSTAADRGGTISGPVRVPARELDRSRAVASRRDSADGRAARSGRPEALFGWADR